MKVEYCITCDEPTGRAGAGEDSMYLGDNGPYCETCFEREIRALHLERGEHTPEGDR